MDMKNEENGWDLRSTNYLAQIDTPTICQKNLFPDEWIFWISCFAIIDEGPGRWAIDEAEYNCFEHPWHYDAAFE